MTSKPPPLSRLAAAGADYKHVTVKLVGEDGNVFSMLGRTVRALRRAGASRAEIECFTELATDGDYNHAIQTIMDWVTVE